MKHLEANFEGHAWRIMRPLPIGIADAPAISYGRMIFLFGGYGKTNEDTKNIVLQYSTAEDRWSSRTPMSKPRWGAVAALLADSVYLFGGMRASFGSLETDVERYNIAKDNWTTLSPLPRHLRAQGLMGVTIGSAIYLFSEAYTYKYDPISDTYSRRANAPLPRKWSTCASVNVASEDRIYIIGGYDSTTRDATNANYYYLPNSDEWIGPQATAPYPALGVTRDNPVYNGKIYFGFGHRKPNIFHNDMHVYDPRKDSWAGPLPKAHFPRDGVACAVVDDGLYVIGGRDEPNDMISYGVTHNERLPL